MPTAMSNAISSAINIIIRFWWVWVIIIAIVFIFKFFYKPKRDQFKEFVIPELKDTSHKGLSKSFDLMGISTKKGKIYRSFQEIAKIRRYFPAQGTFSIEYYDKNNKKFVTSQLNAKKEEIEESKYDLLFVQAHNKFFLWKLLHIKPVYFILKWADSKGNMQLNFNPMTESIILDSKTDLTMYGDVWTNSSKGIEYITNISMIHVNERLQALLDSAPDKYTHLEMETAKLKSKIKLMSEVEKAKYKDREEAGDTTIV